MRITLKRPVDVKTVKVKNRKDNSKWARLAGSKIVLKNEQGRSLWAHVFSKEEDPDLFPGILEL